LLGTAGGALGSARSRRGQSPVNAALVVVVREVNRDAMSGDSADCWGLVKAELTSEEICSCRLDAKAELISDVIWSCRLEVNAALIRDEISF